jgi:Zn-dependent protease with chaperone function
MKTPFTKASFARTYLLPALLLFALPAVGRWFAGHAAGRYDAELLAAVEPRIQSSPELTAEQKEEVRAFYRTLPPSVVCGLESPELAEYRKSLGEACEDLRQFGWIRDLSTGSIVLGLVSALVVVLSALASFISRPLQYASFVVGWNALKVAGALQTLLQGALAVFLSYWMTAIWFERYYPKLILMVGVLAAVGVFHVITAIFRKPDAGLDMEGECIEETSAPELWVRIRELCAQLGTAPPDHLVAGIDDNFFVTEGEVRVGDRTLSGRTLYVSLSLLRILQRSEADAVLAHEMAHFSGGDTTHSKKLSPLLVRFSQYLGALYNGGITRPIFYFMLAYQGLFSLSLGRSNRARELEADAVAARTTSARDIARSLVKVGAYASYRGRVEKALFEKNEQHAQLGIAERVAQGFNGYAQSEALHFDLHGAVTPHPFDSHPPLQERLAHVGVTLAPDELKGWLLEPCESSWCQAITGCAQLEQQLWAAYEARFAQAHDLMLAYRYEPANDDERRHVEKHFPALTFAGKEAGTQVELDFKKVSCAGWDEPLAFADLKEAKVEERMFKKYLDLRMMGGGLFGGTRSICLSKLEQPDALLEAFNRYYGRHLTMVKHRAERTAA